MSELILPANTRELTFGVDEHIEAIHEKFDITVLYGWHRTPEQAQEVVDKVAPGSIVFTEGYLRGEKYARLRLTQHIALAEVQLTYNGKSNLIDLRQQLTGEFIKREHSTPTEHDLHSFTLYEGFLDKGCVVLPSDYINLGDGTPGIRNVTGLRQQLEEVRKNLTENSLEDLVALEAEVFEEMLVSSAIREEAAANWIVYFLNRYVGCDFPSTATEDGGKTPVYVTFGLAHRSSLTERLHSHGLLFNEMYLNSSLIPTEQLMDLQLEYDIPAEERIEAIRKHYIGALALQITHAND